MRSSPNPSRAGAVAATEAALARIASRDGVICAWAHADPEGARRQALEVERLGGPLAGLTIGVKDVIDVGGLPCRFGSPIFQERIAASDAAVVARLKALGAVVVGKTATAEFAYLHPPETRNPRNPARSAGGSSSGSAAAVTDGHVDAALGTQTAGSIIRPASFCGVVGFKPTFGRLSRAGVLSTAPSLDTVGWIARDVAVAARLWRALEEDPETAPDKRIGFFRTVNWSKAEPAMQRRFEQVAAQFSARQIPSPPEALERAHVQIMQYEMAQELVTLRLQHASLLSSEMSEYLARPPIPRDEYLAARRTRDEFAIDRLFGDADALLLPAACGEAVAYGTTGDPSFNRLATLLGLPSVTIPMGTGDLGLPLGLQLLGRHDRDSALLATAAWLEGELAS